MSSKIQKLAAVIGREEGFGPEVWQTTFTDKFAEAIIAQLLRFSYTSKYIYKFSYKFSKTI